jgi:hypothetical protein
LEVDYSKDWLNEWLGNSQVTCPPETIPDIIS